MKRPAAAVSGGASRKRQRVGLTAADAVTQVLFNIPSGQTRTKMEVFRAAMERMGCGDEGIDTGRRTVLGGRLRDLVAVRAKGWHRVVSSDGDLWDDRAAASEQLRLLRAEGARPREGESILIWARRVRADYVGCYKASKDRRCVRPDDAYLDKCPILTLEPITGMASLRQRLKLSGGKHFHLPGIDRPVAPVFHRDSARLTCPIDVGSSSYKSLPGRISKALDQTSLSKLFDTGVIRLRQLLRPAECASLLEFASTATFADVARLDGEAGSGGQYHFCQQAPPLVNRLRSELYGILASSLADSVASKFGTNLGALERRCRSVGQCRCATIFLTFGTGGINLAHQDPYGSLFFPYQAMIMLSRRGTDFDGGEFFVKNLKTGAATDVPADVGDVTIFAANKEASGGADFKHGVRPVRPAANGRCERFSIGVVFNLRK